MSTLLKTTSKAAKNAAKKPSKIGRTDILAAEQDIALESGIALSGEEDSEDDQVDEDDEEDVEMISDSEQTPGSTAAAPIESKGKGTKEKKSKVASDKKQKVSVEKSAVAISAAAQRRKDKVLMLSSRGITGRMRHLMLDLEAILPHLKKGKMEEQDSRSRDVSLCLTSPSLITSHPL
jgi:hypothetical protein